MTQAKPFGLILALLLTFGSGIAAPALAQSGPLRIEITEGVIEPLPFAVPDFVAENGGANEHARNIARVVASDLAGTGLFREIPASAHVGKVTSFDAPIAYADWKAINTQALSDQAALDYCAEVEARMGLPTVDPFRHGAARLVDALAAL